MAQEKHWILEDGKMMRVATDRKQNWSKVNYFLTQQSIFVDCIDIIKQTSEYAKRIDGAFLRAFTQKKFDNDTYVYLFVDLNAPYSTLLIFPQTVLQTSNLKKYIEAHEQHNDAHFKFNIYDVKVDFYVANRLFLREKDSRGFTFIFKFKNGKHFVFARGTNCEFEWESIGVILFVVNLLIFAYKTMHDEKVLDALLTFLRRNMYFDEEEKKKFFAATEIDLQMILKDVSNWCLTKPYLG